MAISTNKTVFNKGLERENSINDSSGKSAGKKAVSQRSSIPRAKGSYVPLNYHYPILLSAPSHSSVVPERISNAINSLENEMQQKMARETLLNTRQIDLPSPKQVSSDKVILWRGCGARQLVRVALYGSFSGTPNQEALPPSEEELKQQVGEKGNFPEFTGLPEVAEAFGTNKFVAVFEINVRYLAQGSPSECGFICQYDAPVRLIGWKEGRKLFSESASAQAASERRNLFKERSIHTLPSSSSPSSS